jgi:hypothetical protein
MGYSPDNTLSYRYAVAAKPYSNIQTKLGEVHYRSIGGEATKKSSQARKSEAKKEAL